MVLMQIASTKSRETTFDRLYVLNSVISEAIQVLDVSDFPHAFSPTFRICERSYNTIAFYSLFCVWFSSTPFPRFRLLLPPCYPIFISFPLRPATLTLPPQFVVRYLVPPNSLSWNWHLSMTLLYLTRKSPYRFFFYNLFWSPALYWPRSTTRGSFCFASWSPLPCPCVTYFTLSRTSCPFVAPLRHFLLPLTIPTPEVGGSFLAAFVSETTPLLRFQSYFVFRYLLSVISFFFPWHFPIPSSQAYRSRPRLSLPPNFFPPSRFAFPAAMYPCSCARLPAPGPRIFASVPLTCRNCSIDVPLPLPDPTPDFYLWYSWWPGSPNNNKGSELMLLPSASLCAWCHHSWSMEHLSDSSNIFLLFHLATKPSPGKPLAI